MIKSITTAVAALALSLAASAPSAQPRYDAQLASPEGKSIAERMVICDTAIFLDTRPNFHANRMFAVRRSTLPSPELLLPPYFIGPDRWYDEDLDIAARRLQSRGEISYDELRAAFDTYSRPVLDRYVGRSSTMNLPRSAIRRKAQACSRFARDLRLGRI